MNIARKYAQAFFAVYEDTITRDLISRIDEAAQFMMTHRRALFLFKVPVIDRSVKEAGLKELCERFQLGDPIKKLLIMLLNDKRAMLIAEVLEAVTGLYRERNKMVSITVASSYPLADDQRVQLEAFIARHVAGEKTYTYTIDPALIAGIRVYSDTFLWEFSIAQQLRDVYNSAIW